MKKQEKCFRSTLIVTNKWFDMDDVKAPYQKVACKLDKHMLLENEKVKDILNKYGVFGSNDKYTLDNKLKK